MSTTATEAKEVAPQASIWEDLIDIFYAPTAVFGRRTDGRFGIALLALTLVMAVLAFGGMSVLGPMYDAEFSRGMDEVMRQNPEITEAQLMQMRAGARYMTLIASVVGMPILVIFLGVVTRVIGAIFGTALTFSLAFAVATYSQFPRLAQQLIMIVQGFVLGPENLTSRFSVSTGPARFMDPDTTSMVLLTLAERFDLFTLWATLLLAIGFRVLGRVSGGKAFTAAALIWLLGTLPPVFGAI